MDEHCPQVLLPTGPTDIHQLAVLLGELVQRKPTEAKTAQDMPIRTLRARVPTHTAQANGHQVGHGFFQFTGTSCFQVSGQSPS
jgi:hypothetical protein